MGLRGRPLSHADVADYETMWESAGRRVSATLDAVAAVAILGDDPVATAAVTLGVAREQALRRRVFIADLLGDGRALSSLVKDDDPHGVSDMMYYGVSLGRAARQHRSSPNLFVIPGGAESPLSDDVLSNPRWRTLCEQVRAAGGLLLLAAPSIVPSIDRLVAQTDGMLLVGDAVSPAPAARILGEVRDAAQMVRTASPATKVVTREVRPDWSARRASLAVLVLAILGASAFYIAPRWRQLLAATGFTPAPTGPVDSTPPPVPPAPAVPVVRSNAAWSVELLFTNSESDALVRLARSVDSLPAATFAVSTTSSDSTRWYRLVSGAFGDSTAAATFLESLRARGALGTGAGAVARTPFALLLDSASSDALASVRVTAYRGRGIPAYGLRDSSGVWHVYAGAFAMEGDAGLLKQRLDSLNIQSVLVVRTGSAP